MSLEQFCTNYVEELCVKAPEACCGGQVPEDLVGGCTDRRDSIARCVSTYSEPATIVSGAARFDGARAAEAARALARARETCFAEPSLEFEQLVPVVGTRGVGEDCAPADDADGVAVFSCRPGLRCAVQTAETPPDSDSPSDWDWRCAERVEVGGDCRTAACVARAYCLDDTCEAMLPDGAECFDSGQCESLFCDENVWRCAPDPEPFCDPESSD